MCAILCNPYTANSQGKNIPDANIVGHVISKSGKIHLPYITIGIEGTNIATMTDATGHYLLKNLPEGELSIVAACLGYKTISRKVIISKAEIIEINFEMEEDALNLDGTIVSATKNETNKKTSSTIVNVLSSKLFSTVSSNTLSESICFQPGVRVENSCANCGAVQLRINGLEGQYTQMLLDSAPIFSSLAGVYGLEQLPVSMIERVEVIRGGGSALFGSNAIGGVVNIITKEPLRNSVTLSESLNVFGKNSIDNNTSLNGSFVSDDYKTGVYLFGLIRNRSAYDRNGDGFSDIPELNSSTLGFRAYRKINTRSKLTAEYHHIGEYRRGGDRLDLQPHEAEIAEQTRHNIDGGSLRYDFFSKDSRHLLSVHTAMQHIDRKSYYGTNMNPDAYGNTKDLSVNSGIHYTWKINRLIWSPSDLSFGIEYNYNALHDNMLGYGRELKQNTSIIGGYIQNEWKNETVNLLAGARIDKHNLMKNPVISPRINIRYTPVDWIGLRASYSSGFRAPQAFNEDLHIEAVGGTVSIIRLAPDLKPEYSHSLSASADFYHNFGRVQTNLLVEGFYTRLNNVFELINTETFDSYGNLIFERTNTSGAQVTGLNTELMIGIPEIFDIQIGYTFQKSLFLKDFEWSTDIVPQRNMFRSPDHYAYITSNFHIWKTLKLSVYGNVTGPMLVQHTSTGENIPDSEKWTETFADAGLNLSYEFKISGNFRIETNAGVKNMFDQFQKDLDYGATKDAGYIYGSDYATHLACRGQIQVIMTQLIGTNQTEKTE